MNDQSAKRLCFQCKVAEVPDTAFFVMLCDPCLWARLEEQKANAADEAEML